MDREEGGLSPGRIEALCDGVFAIAMTLLVLELHVPERLGVGGLPGELRHLLPKLVSYAVSFVILGTLWVGHHYQFHFIHRSDRALLWINLGFLLFISFLPFATALVGSYPGQRAAVLTYGGTLMAAGLCLFAQWEYVSRRRRLLGSAADATAVRAIRARVVAGTLCYAVALLTAVWAPGPALVLFALMPLLYLVPTRIDRHVRGHE
jgi:uncharacterized membrane protein